MTFLVSIPLGTEDVSYSSLYLCWTSPEVAHNRHSKDCWILMNHFGILHTLLTPHSNPEQSPFFYMALITLNLSVPKSLRKNVNIWRQGPLWFTRGSSKNFCWVNGHVSSSASSCIKTSVQVFKFPHEQPLKNRGCEIGKERLPITGAFSELLCPSIIGLIHRLENPQGNFF